MYFPILRGRQFELIALRELLQKKLIGKSIFPIIEPVKLSSTLCATLATYRCNNAGIGVVRNPAVGNFSSDLQKVEKAKAKNKLADEFRQQAFTNVLYLNMKRPISIEAIKRSGIEIADCISIFSNKDSLELYLKIFGSSPPNYCLIPDERSIRRRITAHKVILDNKFIKKTRNTDYAIIDDEPFSEDHLFYKDEGYVGFSDYSIVGDDYNKSGFAPYAVAIHIVYFDHDHSLRIHHFVSDSNDDISDQAGKFAEALYKLIKWNQKYRLKTEAMREFERLYQSQQYPGLGSVKKLSIMHHLELMSHYLDGV